MPTVPNLPVAPGAAIAPVVTPTTTAAPPKLSKGEWCVAAMLVLAGALLITILLSAFMARADDWSLKSKESTETTAASGDAGEKTVETVEYSDSVLITGLGLGALLILTGAFYGRIREITLPGGSGLKLDPPAEAVIKAEEKAAAAAQTDDAVEEDEVKREAEALLPQIYALDVLQGPPSTYTSPGEYSDDLAERAVDAALLRVKRSAG